MRVDGRPVAESAKGARVCEGMAVEVASFTRPGRECLVAEPDTPLVLLAEGPGWLAVEKPAGIPVHPLREGETGTMLNAVVARYPGLQGVGEGGLRSGVIHRLDVDTSGALLVATEELCWQRLRRAFREHRVEKVYRAVVLGRLEREGSVELGLATARHRPARVRVVRPDERARGVRIAVLRWSPLEVFEAATLVEVRPVTGFLHQIRPTFAHLGFPVAGDRSYGSREDATGAPRQMLHAARVAFAEIGGLESRSRGSCELVWVPAPSRRASASDAWERT